MNGVFNQKLRWILVPFAAVLGFFVGSAVILINDYGYAHFNGWGLSGFFKAIMDIVANGVAAGGFVLGGSMMAPGHKRECSIVLAVICCVFAVGLSIVYSVVVEFSVLQIVRSLAFGIGAVIACSYVEDEEIGAI